MFLLLTVHSDICNCSCLGYFCKYLFVSELIIYILALVDFFSFFLINIGSMIAYQLLIDQNLGSCSLSTPQPMSSSFLFSLSSFLPFSFLFLFAYCCHFFYMVIAFFLFSFLFFRNFFFFFFFSLFSSK